MILPTKKKIQEIAIETYNTLNTINNVKDKDEKYTEDENRLWYNGTADQLLKFYRTRFKQGYLLNNTNFYKRINSNNEQKHAVYHYNLGKLISKGKSDLVFKDFPVFSFDSLDEELNVQINSEISRIIDETELQKVLSTAGEYLSYSGCCGFKYIIDRDICDCPIILVYPKEDLIINKKYGKVISITFIDRYGDYTLYSTYKKGSISYELKNKKNESVPLDKCEETKDLKDVFLKDQFGNELNYILADYIENNNCDSDYYHIIDNFNAIDQLYTQMMDIVEKSSIIEYMPESLLQKDIRTDTTIIPNTFDRNVVVLHDSNYSDKKEQVERSYLDSSNLINTLKTNMSELIKQTLSEVGLSANSVGLGEYIGANSSADAINVRDKLSIQTKLSLITKWKPVLKSIIKNLLFLNYSVFDSEDNIVFNTDFTNEFKVQFNESNTYLDLQDVANSLINLVNNNLLSRSKALEILNKDFYKLSQEELDLMEDEINGITLTYNDTENYLGDDVNE